MVGTPAYNKALQNPNVVLPEAVNMISLVKQGLTEIRTETAFRELINNAKTVAVVDAVTCREFPAPTRPRTRKRLFNYATVDQGWPT